MQFLTAPTSEVCFFMGIGATSQRSSDDIQPFEKRSSLATYYTGPRKAMPTKNWSKAVWWFMSIR